MHFVQNYNINDASLTFCFDNKMLFLKLTFKIEDDELIKTSKNGILMGQKIRSRTVRATLLKDL